MATFWNILGPLAYLVWIFSFIWVSLWAQIRNTPTLRARRYRLHTIFRNCQNAGTGIIVSSLPVALCLWWSSFLGVDLSSFLLPCFVLSVCMLICLPIYGYFDRRVKSVVEEDLHLPGKRYGVPSYDVPAIEHRFFLALFANMLLAETIVAFYLAFLLYTCTFQV